MSAFDVVSLDILRRAVHQGWVFALSGEVASKFRDLIEAKYEVNSTILTVL